MIGEVPLVSGRRFVAMSALFGGVMSLASIAAFGAAFGFQQDALVPDLTQLSPSDAGVFRWGALTDMLGFYLAPIPIMVYLRQRAAASDALKAALGATAGVTYAVIGSIGAVILASSVPPLIDGGTQAARDMLSLIRDVVFVGLWQTLETIPLAVWMLMTANQLERGWLKVVALVIAAGSAVAAAGRLFEVDAAVMALGPALLLFPFWLLGVGWKLLGSDSL